MSRLEAVVRLERRPAGGPPFRLECALDAGSGVTVVCGRSGSGKSTLLACLLGALRPDAGSVALDGRALFDSAAGVDRPIRDRRMGMVFQDAPLFPHLDVMGNVCFGIRGPDRRRRGSELLERVGAWALATRRAGELSGGERQRVALARALATKPDALLLDEPFSALDASARETLGRLIVELQGSTGIPFVHVTHDLGEALRLGTQLVLLEGGRVVQRGAPGEVIARPASLAAARAVGTENLFRGRIVDHAAEEGCTSVDLGGTVVRASTIDLPVGATVALGLRAEDVLLSLDPVFRTSARNVIPGKVESVEPHEVVVELRVTTPVPFRVVVTPASIRELALAPGRPVHLLIKAAAFHRLL